MNGDGTSREVPRKTKIGIRMFDAKAYYSDTITGLTGEEGTVLMARFSCSLKAALPWVHVDARTNGIPEEDSAAPPADTVQLILSEDRVELSVRTGADEALKSRLIKEVCQYELENLRNHLDTRRSLQGYFDDLKKERRFEMPAAVSK